MAVVITNIDMPQCCRECPLFVDSYYEESNTTDYGCRVMDWEYESVSTEMYNQMGLPFHKRRHEECQLAQVD